MSRRRTFYLALATTAFFAVSACAAGPTTTQKENLIIFIHGFMGDNHTTWTNSTSKAFWPDLIKSDPAFTTFDIDTYAYPAALTQQGLTTNELSTRFFEHLVQKSHHYNSVFIIAHSFGGVITMDALSKLADFESDVFEKIKGVFLLAVPFKGTEAVTKSLRYLAPSQIVDELESSNTNSYLQNLDNRWLKITKEGTNTHKRIPQVHVAYEKKKTSFFLFFKKLLVDSKAIFPYHDDLQGPLAVYTNHTDIAKPENREDVIYRWVDRHIKDILDGYSPVIITDFGINLEQSPYYFDTQSRLPDLTPQFLPA